MIFDIILHVRKKMFVNPLGGAYGILSVVSAIILGVLALISDPNYIFFEDMISELGVGQGGIFFNFGLIFSGVTAIPFFISLGRSLNYEGVNEKLRKSAISFSIFSCISMSLVGFFPAIQEDEIISMAHGISTALCWFSGIIFTVLFSMMFLKASKFSKFQAYMGFFVAVIFILVLCTWLPITEYAIVIAIMIWVVTNAITLIRGGMKNEIEQGT